ncbi:MAG TPA: hypothetical protein ENF56_00035 [Candidatus Bathyarchaeota archaeon]|nr:hypothetical protein [Candidatus Bathyarchaeota archaeon]
MVRKKLRRTLDKTDFLKEILKNVKKMDIRLDIMDAPFLWGVEVFTLNGRSTLSSVGNYLRCLMRLNDKTNKEKRVELTRRC